MTKLHIKKGDTVQVLSGESRGRQGKVLKVYPEKQRALVEGVNMVSRSRKPDAKHPQGGIQKQEAPLHISNLALLDPKSGKPTRVSIQRDTEGRPVRISKKSGEEIK